MKKLSAGMTVKIKANGGMFHGYSGVICDNYDDRIGVVDILCSPKKTDFEPFIVTALKDQLCTKS